MSLVIDGLTIARLIDNYEKDATGGTALWPDTTHYKATVPISKRWFLIGGITNRDASQTVQVSVFNASDELILQLMYASAATGVSAYPNTVATASSMVPPAFLPMDSGWYVQATFGGAQSTSAEASCLVLEVNV